jgi:two-component system, NtrC family, nitrogen regulation response regulator GlnG
MVEHANGRGDKAAELDGAARALADAVPLLVERLSAASTGQLYREALELLERPLLGYALSLTGGNQLRAARLLGLNRNTLRKRCRELRLALPGRSGRSRGG